jgi:ATP-dependent protease ClpP protease subunit
MFLFAVLGSLLAIASASTEIILTPKNSLLIRGQINAATATDFIYEVNKRPKKEGLYLYLDTNGGSVDAGNKIINEIAKYNISCIAERAISMGFVILQSCNNRYITPSATLMQHQMSYGVVNEKEKVESYVQFIKQIGDQLTTMQANRIGISAQEFKERTYNDWWIFGGNGVNENCADDIAMVKCNTKLTNLTYAIDYAGNSYLFSYCPLINGPVEVKPKSKSSKSGGRYYTKSIEDVYI